MTLKRKAVDRPVRACGRPYPVTTGVVESMRTVAFAVGPTTPRASDERALILVTPCRRTVNLVPSFHLPLPILY